MTKNRAELEALRLLDWGRLRVRAIWAYESQPRSMSAAIVEPGTTMAWLLDEGRVEVEGTTSGLARAKAGDWIILPGDKARHRFSPDSRIISIRFLAHWPNGLPLFSDTRPVVIPAARFPELRRSAMMLVRTIARLVPPASVITEILNADMALSSYAKLEVATWRWLATYGQVMDAIGIQRNAMARSDPRVAGALMVIDRHPTNEQFDEARFARRAGLSPSQLNRLFTAQVGMTPYDYFQKRRLEVARQLLLTQRLPVKQVAYTVGFKHSSHFCRWFSVQTGVTPGIYRQGRLRQNQVVQ